MLILQHSYNNFVLEYMVFGNGTEPLLCFHGFSRKADDYLLFKNAWENKHKIFSFNFFHHGNSVYPLDRVDRNTLTANEWNEIMLHFLVTNKIESFSMAGYSMGGKLCLSMFLHYKERVNKIYLFAPDGIKENFWYKFTSRNVLGNILYRKIMHKPWFFFATLKFLKNIKLLDDKLYRFVISNLESYDKRRLVYCVWMTMRHIRPSLKQVKHILFYTPTEIELYFGKYDKIIPVKLGYKFKNMNPEKIKLQLVECGHNMFNEKTLEALCH